MNNPQIGNGVIHATYGTGVISSVSTLDGKEKRCGVDFEDGKFRFIFNDELVSNPKAGQYRKAKRTLKMEAGMAQAKQKKIKQKGAK